MRARFLTFCLSALLASLPGYGAAQDSEDKPAATKPQEEVRPLSKEEQAEARRVAQAERAREAERERAAREKLCIIKPVMTDAEIAYCKEVWR